MVTSLLATCGWSFTSKQFKLLKTCMCEGTVGKLIIQTIKWSLIQSQRQWYGQFLRENNGIAWILTYVCYRLAFPSSLGRLRGLLWTFSSLRASKVLTRELRLLNFLADTWARDQCANWGGANMGIVRSCHFWQLGSNHFFCYRNYRWGDSSSILAQTWLQKRSQSAEFKKNFLGEHAPRPP